MHESHQAFYTDDGALSCRRCIICECHMPKQAAEPCPNALPMVHSNGSRDA